VDEFVRLYGRMPSHFDGHRHLHLCANMLVSGIIPEGFAVRRSFSFAVSEKGIAKCAYRALVDARLAYRYRLADYFFSLENCMNGDGKSVARVMDLARVANVEVMTHARKAEEFNYLSGDECGGILRSVEAGTYSQLVPSNGTPLASNVRRTS
jgi:predicted glycoside hydrolase/deacetylase ChbG (UPF0249 family)